MLRPIDALDNVNADVVVDAVDAVAANAEAVANAINNYCSSCPCYRSIVCC